MANKAETVVQMQSNAEDKLNQFDNDAHSQIKELLSFEVDDAFIQQLQETNENLKPYM